MSWNAAGCSFIGGVCSSRRTTQGLDVIDGAFHRAGGRRSARRHRRNFVVPGDFRARHHRQSLSLRHSAESFVVSQVVAGRTSRGSTSSAQSLTSCRGSSPCATSSTEPLRCVAECRRVRCLRQRLSLRREMSLGVTSRAESFRRVGRRGCSTLSTEPFIVPRDVVVHDIIAGISYVVLWDFGDRYHQLSFSPCRWTSPGERRWARPHRQSLLHCAAGHCRARRHRWSLSSCRGTPPGATSSA